jgi:hypothetical protein
VKISKERPCKKTGPFLLINIQEGIFKLDKKVIKTIEVIKPSDFKVKPGWHNAHFAISSIFIFSEEQL